jgi:quinoprotein glucose dehydrogenase
MQSRCLGILSTGSQDSTSSSISTGFSAVTPPWGTLNAINMNTGEYVWKIRLGEYPELAAKGVKDTGSENYGGPIVTAGGLVFIAATLYDQQVPGVR